MLTAALCSQQHDSVTTMLQHSHIHCSQLSSVCQAGNPLTLPGVLSPDPIPQLTVLKTACNKTLLQITQLKWSEVLCTQQGMTPCQHAVGLTTTYMQQPIHTTIVSMMIQSYWYLH